MKKSPNGIYPESFAVMNREMMSSSLAESTPSKKRGESHPLICHGLGALTHFFWDCHAGCDHATRPERSKHGDVRVLLGTAEDRKGWRIETP